MKDPKYTTASYGFEDYIHTYLHYPYCYLPTTYMKLWYTYISLKTVQKMSYAQWDKIK